MEQWKAVPGYETMYEVSNEGRVRRLERHLMALEVAKRNYRRVTLAKPRKRWQVHRLVMLAFVGQCPDGHNVNHKDGNPANNRIENLEYVTQKANILHAFRELKRPPHHRGETTHFAKLTDMDVIQIRRMRAEGQSYKDIASHFNTKPANVWHICAGKTWKHLLPTLPVPSEY